MLSLNSLSTTNKRGLLSVFGGFLIQLCTGCYHGTFGNLLPYLSSYVRQTDDNLSNGDLAMIFSIGGLTQGITFILGGLMLVPSVGTRLSLVIAASIFTSAPLLTYLCLVMNARVEFLWIVYGMFSSGAISVLVLVTTILPTSWFPNHRGRVVGFISSGFGLSSTIFTPIQTYLVNPNNIEPVKNDSSMASASYFTNPEVLESIPNLFLYMGAIYAIMFIIGIILCSEAPKETQEDEKEDSALIRLKAAWKFMYHEASRSLNFYLLFLARFLYLAICAGALAHWKTFSFTQSNNDQVMSIVGSGCGVLNCLSRVLAGFLFDKLGYRKLMTIGGILLTINLGSIFWVGQSLPGIMISVWCLYLFGNTHFATIPAQALRLFPGSSSYVVFGCIGLSETPAYLTLAILNQTIMNDDSNPQMFMIFFMVLATLGLFSIPITWFVSDPKRTSSKTNIEMN